jgi:hypothetical protein
VPICKPFSCLLVAPCSKSRSYSSLHMFVRSVVCHLSSTLDVVWIWGHLDVLIMGIRVAASRCMRRLGRGRKGRCLDRVQRQLSG